MSGESLRTLREGAGLTQAQLAARAGVSRQLVGAVEQGRHLPRVDAALALAAVLGVEVEALFRSEPAPVEVISGSRPPEGALVRAGWVGDQPVTAPVRIGADGWDVADGAVRDGSLSLFEPRRPGLVVAGCEPGLEVLERLLREAGMGAVAASASSAAAIAALAGGRVHAAVVHGPDPDLSHDRVDIGVDRFHLARWRVGLAGPPEATSGWWQEPLSGRVPVVQREPGAGVQRAFEEAVGRRDVPGPRVGSHLQAARRAVLTGMPAVTIEPAALAVGAAFHPLQAHEAQIWVAEQWQGERFVTEALNIISGRRFRLRLRGVGGYDLTDTGTRAA